MDEGGIYVEIHYFRFKKVGVEETQHPEELAKIVSLLRTLGYDDKVYGIRPADVKLLARYENWVSLEAFLEAVLEEHSDLIDAVNKSQSWWSLDDRGYFTHFFEANLDNTTLFGRFIKEAKEAHDAAQNEKAIAYGKMAKTCQRELENDDDEGFLKKMCKQVFATYPLLGYLRWYDADEDKFINGVVDYIKGVGK